jgi:hypothetical protein
MGLLVHDPAPFPDLNDSQRPIGTAVGCFFGTDSTRRQSPSNLRYPDLLDSNPLTTCWEVARTPLRNGWLNILVKDVADGRSNIRM